MWRGRGGEKMRRDVMREGEKQKKEGEVRGGDGSGRG